MAAWRSDPAGAAWDTNRAAAELVGSSVRKSLSARHVQRSLRQAAIVASGSAARAEPKPTQSATAQGASQIPLTATPDRSTDPSLFPAQAPAPKPHVGWTPICTSLAQTLWVRVSTP